MKLKEYYDKDDILENHLSESISLLNSRMRISQKSKLHTNKQSNNEYSNNSSHDDRFNKSKNEMDQSMSQIELQKSLLSKEEIQNYEAVQEFKREIEQRYRLSIANKIYTFPRLLIKDVFDLISLSGSQGDDKQDDEVGQQKEENDEDEDQIEKYNPFVQNLLVQGEKIKEKQEEMRMNKVNKMQNYNQNKQKDKDKDKDKEKYYDFKKKHSSIVKNNKKCTKGMKQTINNDHRKKIHSSATIKSQRQNDNFKKIKKKQQPQIFQQQQQRNQRLKTELDNEDEFQNGLSKYSYLYGNMKVGKQVKNKHKAIFLQNQIIEDENEENLGSEFKKNLKIERLKTEMIESSNQKQQFEVDRKINKEKIQQKWKRIILI